MSDTDERNKPYIKREAGDFITAQDWNNMQSEIRKTLNEHSHNGQDDEGVKLKGEAIDNTSPLTVAGLDVTGGMNVKGTIRAEKSEIYFTKTNHQYEDTSKDSDQEGFASIHNASDYGALMIMGRRSGGPRKVQVWDALNVVGKLEVTKGNEAPELIVNGPIHSGGDLSVKGLLSVEGDVTANKNLTVKDSLTVNGNVSISGPVDSPTMVDIVARTFNEANRDRAIALRVRNQYHVTDRDFKDSAVDFVVSRFEDGGDHRPKTQLDIRLSGNDNERYDQSIPNVDVLTLRSNGNVGIGVTDPRKPLHLYSDGKVNPVLVENVHPNNDDARNILNSSKSNCFLLGGPQLSELYFYWKSKDNNAKETMYRYILKGTAF